MCFYNEEVFKKQLITHNLNKIKFSKVCTTFLPAWHLKYFSPHIHTPRGEGELVGSNQQSHGGFITVKSINTNADQ